VRFLDNARNKIEKNNLSTIYSIISVLLPLLHGENRSKGFEKRAFTALAQKDLCNIIVLKSSDFQL